MLVAVPSPSFAFSPASPSTPTRLWSSRSPHSPKYAILPNEKRPHSSSRSSTTSNFSRHSTNSKTSDISDASFASTFSNYSQKSTVSSCTSTITSFADLTDPYACEFAVDDGLDEQVDVPERRAHKTLPSRRSKDKSLPAIPQTATEPPRTIKRKPLSPSKAHTVAPYSASNWAFDSESKSLSTHMAIKQAEPGPATLASFLDTRSSQLQLLIKSVRICISRSKHTSLYLVTLPAPKSFSIDEGTGPSAILVSLKKANGSSSRTYYTETPSNSDKPPEHEQSRIFDLEIVPGRTVNDIINIIRAVNGLSGDGEYTSSRSSTSSKQGRCQEWASEVVDAFLQRGVVPGRSVVLAKTIGCSLSRDADKNLCC